MRTTIYVDEFNLYYGCLKNTNYKWLNLEVLFSNILEDHHSIDRICYFTARFKEYSNDLNAHLLQMAYLNVLESLPNLEVIYGRFVSHNVRMPLVTPPPNTVEVIKTEEKGSDVNFSVHLLNDAWEDRYECAVLVTDDSDMAEAMRLVKSQFSKKKLGLITPRGRPTSELRKYADFKKTIRDDDLKTAQFSNPVQRPRPKRDIHKP
jgi:uncharacterized LabA/DUF88 family protein